MDLVGHVTNPRNEIETLLKSFGQVEVPFAHDADGSVIQGRQERFNGATYQNEPLVFRYDAWNRLVAVHFRGSATAGPDGVLSTASGLGLAVLRLRYDGLGRLIVTERIAGGFLQPPTYTTEHCFYDGVRRIQEVDDAGTADPADDTTVHEYVYGPEYVDEFVLQTRRDSQGNQQPLYMLQDANYNVMALLDSGGGVLVQYVWDPYGHALAVDDLSDPDVDNRVGHQGLFFYRLGFSIGSVTFCPTGTCQPNGLYYNRNRFYDPDLGRFIQRDPNETALLVISTMAMNGDALSALAAAFDAQGHFGDGMNLYLLARANPVVGFDPLGLYDPFEAADECIAQLQAEKAEAAAQVIFGIGALSAMAQRMALEALITAVVPGGALIVSAWSMGEIWADIKTGGLKPWNAVDFSMELAGGAGDLVRVFGEFSRHRHKIGALRGVSDAERAFRAFDYGNFRYNLSILTGIDASDAVQAHHVLPVKHEDYFLLSGIDNIHDPKYGSWWDASDHRSHALMYEEDWDDFFDSPRTKAQVESKARELADFYGFEINF